MTTKPSTETQLRNAKRELKHVEQYVADIKASLEHYRRRATQAEQECAEWKTRFDKLLSAARVTVQPIEGESE